MSARVGRLAVIAASVLVGVVAVPGGTALARQTLSTAITLPAGPVTFHFKDNVQNTLHVEGTTSPDVTKIKIGCFERLETGGVSAIGLSDVLTVSGTFSTDLTFDTPLQPCRLRAIAYPVDPTTEPIGAFTGPMLYTWATHLESYLVPTPYGYDAVTGAGDGSVEMQAGCASTFQATYTPPQPDRLGPGVGTCHIGLSPKDQTSASPGSSVKVDGHDAYLPSGVYQYLLAERALFTLTVPTITVSISHSTDGSLHVTEADPLMRCSVDDTYPPTVASCPLLVPTGVTLHRKIDTIRGLHQVRVRDQWVSTDGQAHSVSVRYFGQAAGTQPGFRFPGDAQFQLTTAGQQVSNLGTKAGTLLERSDFSAPSTDLAVNTFGITWSRPPSNVSFAPTFKTMYALAYTLSVSPSHPGYLGFAVSEHGSTSAATTLGGQAVADMVSRPTISTPANHATISGHSTTVKGSVTLGANGLPTSVTVNGHAAHLTPVSATKETYSVTFTESLGTHQLNVVAKDSVGNTASRSITVKNVA